MKTEFIKVNKTIFDYKAYIREVEWLKFDIKRRILDLLEKDFIKLEEIEETYDQLFLKLYNKRLDLHLHVECKKQSREIFV